MIFYRLRRATLVVLLVSLVVVLGQTPSTAAPGDLDDDTVLDAVDLDDDNDGIPDTVEGYSCSPTTLTVYSQDFDSYDPWRVAPAVPTGSVLPIESDADNWWSRTGGTISDQSVNAASAFFLPGDLKGLATSDIILWVGDAPGTDMDYLFVSKPFTVSAATSYAINVDNAGDNSAPIPALELFVSADDGATWQAGVSLPHSTTFQTSTINYTTSSETSLVLRVGNSTAGSNGNDGGINNVQVTTPGEICSGVDTDGDSIEDHQDLDSDNDGISDLSESTGISDPPADPDHNGIIDGPEFTDSNADGLADVVGAGTTPINSDGTDAADFRDLDSDNDGIPDAVEAQPTSSYAASFDYSTATDLDSDGVLSIFDLATTFGGTFSVPVNTDSLTGPDYLDTDSDEDTIPDSTESGAAATGVTYSDPNGSVNDPTTDLANQFGDTSEVAYREVPNVAPTSADDTQTGLTLGAPTTINPLANDSDSDGTLNATSVSIVHVDTTDAGRSLVVPDQGTWSVHPTTGQITFAPLVDFISDPTDINYQVDDDDGATSSPATISLNYDGEPDAIDDTTSTNQDASLLITWSDNDFLADNAVIDGFDTTSTEGGVVALDSADVFAYTPANGYVGADTFQYTICDDDVPTPTCDSATISVVVSALSYQIDGRAFLDASRDGLYDVGEADLPTYTVRLLQAGIDATLGTADDVEVQSLQASGAFAFSTVADGSYLVVLDSATVSSRLWTTSIDTGYGPGRTELIVAGSNASVDPFGYFYAAIRGVIVDANGNPEVGASVSIVDSGGNTFSATTNASGAYLFQGESTESLASGTATITVQTADGRTATSSTNVAGAGIAVADLALTIAVTTSTNTTTSSTTAGATTTSAASTQTTTGGGRASLPVTGGNTDGLLKLSLVLVLSGVLIAQCKELAELIQRSLPSSETDPVSSAGEDILNPGRLEQE